MDRLRQCLSLLAILFLLYGPTAIKCCHPGGNIEVPVTIQESDVPAVASNTTSLSALAALAAAAGLANAGSGANISTTITTNATQVSNSGSGSNSAVVANAALLAALASIAAAVCDTDVDPDRRSQFGVSMSPNRVHAKVNQRVIVRCSATVELPEGCRPMIIVEYGESGSAINPILLNALAGGSRRTKRQTNICNINSCTTSSCDTECDFGCTARGLMANGDVVRDVYCEPRCETLAGRRQLQAMIKEQRELDEATERYHLEASGSRPKPGGKKRGHVVTDEDDDASAERIEKKPSEKSKKIEKTTITQTEAKSNVSRPVESVGDKPRTNITRGGGVEKGLKRPRIEHEDMWRRMS